MWIPHILTVCILVIFPIMGFYNIRALRSNHHSKAKIKTYFIGIIWLWALVCGISIVFPSEQIFYSQQHVEIRQFTILTILIAAYFIITTFIPLWLIRYEKFRSIIVEAYEKRSFIYPITRQEQFIFIFVAITVGICEEIIFRSFLVQYVYNLPWDLSLLTCFIIVNIIFGAGHFHQGISGMFNATIMGFLFSYLFITTGNLLLPILLHILVDLKILIIPYAYSLSNKN